MAPAQAKKDRPSRVLMIVLDQDAVGLVATDVTYGVMGDHGGHNEPIQEVPMVFAGPGVNPKDSGRRLRLVDAVPTILESMGIAYDESAFDGEAVNLSAPGR